MTTLTGFRVDPTEVPPNRERTAFVNVPDTPEGLQEATGSELVDVVVRYVRGVPYNFVIDDEGLLRQRRPSVSGPGLRILLVGTVLVLGMADDGELRSLTAEERTEVQKHIRAVRTVDGNVQWMLMDVYEPWEVTALDPRREGP